MNENRLYESAVKKWGSDFEVSMLIEELSKLIYALSKFNRNPSQTTAENVCEEIADTDIMKEQVKMVLRKTIDNFRPDDVILMFRNAKLKRLEAMLEDK
jgi:archaellum component FlaC